MIELDKAKPLLPDNVYNQLLDVCIKYDITTPLRLCHFLAQCSHESKGFERVEENLNYSFDALLRVFPKYFDINNVEKYAHNRVAIASRVYANRMGNGTEQSQDGWKYRGRGYIQLTGKDNYSAFNDTVNDNLLAYPNLVSTKYAIESAAWFWNSRKLNSIADKGSDQNVISEVTKVINGGYKGLEDRQNKFDRFYNTYS